MNRSEISNDFNFQNELDISNTRKDRTENYFTREGFQFQDFMNVGDRTAKSDKFNSQINVNTSVISKKEGDEPLPSNFFSDLSHFEGKRKLTLQDNLQIPKNEQVIGMHPSPKFGQSVANTSKSIPLPESPRKKQFTLRKGEQGVQQRRHSPKKTMMGVESAFKKKENPVSQQESEYKAMECQIRFYREQIQKMIFQSEKMEEQTENLMGNFNSESYEKELEMHGRDIKGINRQIQEERQLEVQLNKMVQQLEEEYEGVVNSIKTANFPRPALVKDEAKALIDEINGLRAEFQALERDDGSLNLSSTLLQLPSNTGFTPQITTQRYRKNECETAKLRIKEIFEQNKSNSDPRFLTNLKHACLKGQWSLYANSELQVSVSFREAPHILIRVGNKLSKDLSRFSLRQNQVAKLSGQIIAAQSYFQHFLDINPALVNDLFLKMELSYEVFGDKKEVVFFVPVGLTNFGQFSPITQREFQNDAGTKPFEYCGGFRPIDKKIIASVSEMTVYMPNLIVDAGREMCFGLFISPFDDCELVLVRQRGESLSISTKNQNWPLIRLLEFIFTV